MAFKRELLTYALPFPKTNEIGHDLYLGLCAEIARGGVQLCSTPLILYRRSEDSFCNIFEKSGRSLLHKIWGRVVMIYYVSKFWIKYNFGYYKKNRMRL